MIPNTMKGKAALHLSWSPWLHCESSFDLALVPQSPGLFAVGIDDSSGKRLTIAKFGAVDNLSNELNRLFSSGCPFRKQFEEGRCLLRYAVVPDAEVRRLALAELQIWLLSQTETNSALVAEFLHWRKSRCFRGAED